MLAPIDAGLAFLEGLALIASPCILPVLPLVLSASITGGRSRPYGIILGFIVAFSAFALGSAALVKSLGINLELIKQVSLILLALFALTLIITPLSEKFSQLSQGLSQAGNRFISK